MITTVTLNAAVDKVLVVERLVIGGVNRVRELTAEPGGKGNNVAKVARILGADVTASGFLGGETGRFVHRQLTARGIVSDPVWIEGMTREALAILDPAAATQTEILEPGPFVDRKAWEELCRKVGKLAGESTIVCFSGSLPPGLEPDAYAELVKIARARGALTFLDTSGEALVRGMESVPDFVKPNRDEIEQLAGTRIRDRQDIIETARTYIRRGTRAFIVTLDEEGALVVTGNGVWSVIPPRVKVVNTVGCGDAVVGGIACHLDRFDRGHVPDDGQIADGLRMGVAAAASNAGHLAGGYVDKAEYEKFLSEVALVSV